MKTNSSPTGPALKQRALRPALLVLLALAGASVASTTGLAQPGLSIVISSDDYVYYPDSEVYYNNYNHRYIYRNGDRWFTGTQPPRRWNRRAAFVHLDFHDAPQRHHADITHSYPKNWRPHAPENRDRHDNDRKGDDHRDNDKDRRDRDEHR